MARVFSWKIGNSGKYAYLATGENWDIPGYTITGTQISDSVIKTKISNTVSNYSEDIYTQHFNAMANSAKTIDSGITFQPASFYYNITGGIVMLSGKDGENVSTSQTICQVYKLSGNTAPQKPSASYPGGWSELPLVPSSITDSNVCWTTWCKNDGKYEWSEPTVWYRYMDTAEDAILLTISNNNLSTLVDESGYTRTNDIEECNLILTYGSKEVDTITNIEIKDFPVSEAINYSGDTTNKKLKFEIKKNKSLLNIPNSFRVDVKGEVVGKEIIGSAYVTLTKVKSDYLYELSVDKSTINQSDNSEVNKVNIRIKKSYVSEKSEYVNKDNIRDCKLFLKKDGGAETEITITGTTDIAYTISHEEITSVTKNIEVIVKGGNIFNDSQFINIIKDGIDGKDGKDIEYVYHIYPKSKTSLDDEDLNQENGWVLKNGAYEENNNPQNTNDWIPKDKEQRRPNEGGWTDNPVSVSANTNEWCACRKKGDNGKWERFNTPFIWSSYGEKGRDGDGIEYIFHLSQSESDDSKPQINENYGWIWNSGISQYVTSDTRNQSEWIPDDFFGNRPGEGGWTDDPQSVSEAYKYQWVSKRKYTNGSWGYFCNPTIWTSINTNGLLVLDNENITIGTGQNDTILNTDSYDNCTLSLYYGSYVCSALTIVSMKVNDVDIPKVDNIYTLYNNIVITATTNTNNIRLDIFMPSGLDLTDKVEISIKVQGLGDNKIYEDAKILSIIGLPSGADGVSYKLLLDPTVLQGTHDRTSWNTYNIKISCQVNGRNESTAATIGSVTAYTNEGDFLMSNDFSESIQTINFDWYNKLTQIGALTTTSSITFKYENSLGFKDTQSINLSTNGQDGIGSSSIDFVNDSIIIGTGGDLIYSGESIFENSKLNLIYGNKNCSGLTFNVRHNDIDITGDTGVYVIVPDKLIITASTAISSSVGEFIDIETEIGDGLDLRKSESIFFEVSGKNVEGEDCHGTGTLRISGSRGGIDGERYDLHVTPSQINTDFDRNVTSWSSSSVVLNVNHYVGNTPYDITDGRIIYTTDDGTTGTVITTSIYTGVSFNIIEKLGALSATVKTITFRYEAADYETSGLFDEETINITSNGEQGIQGEDSIFYSLSILPTELKIKNNEDFSSNYLFINAVKNLPNTSYTENIGKVYFCTDDNFEEFSELCDLSEYSTGYTHNIGGISMLKSASTLNYKYINNSGYTDIKTIRIYKDGENTYAVDLDNENITISTGNNKILDISSAFTRTTNLTILYGKEKCVNLDIFYLKVNNSARRKKEDIIPGYYTFGIDQNTNPKLTLSYPINTGDTIKGTLSFNNGLALTAPYVIFMKVSGKTSSNQVITGTTTLTITGIADGKNGEEGTSYDIILNPSDIQTNHDRTDWSSDKVFIDVQKKGATASTRATIGCLYYRVDEQNEKLLCNVGSNFTGYTHNIKTTPELVTAKTITYSYTNDYGFTDTESLKITSDGAPGVSGTTGRDGAAIRGPYEWGSDNTLRRFCNGSGDTEEDKLWIDIIAKSGETTTKYYRCTTSYNGTLSDDWATVYPNYWEESDVNYDFIAANLLLADNAKIKFMSGNNIYLMSGDTVTAGAAGGGGVSFWAGGTGETDNKSKLKIYYNGTLEAGSIRIPYQKICNLEKFTYGSSSTIMQDVYIADLHQTYLISNLDDYTVRTKTTKGVSPVLLLPEPSDEINGLTYRVIIESKNIDFTSDINKFVYSPALFISTIGGTDSFKLFNTQFTNTGNTTFKGLGFYGGNVELTCIPSTGSSYVWALTQSSIGVETLNGNGFISDIWAHKFGTSTSKLSTIISVTDINVDDGFDFKILKLPNQNTVKMYYDVTLPTGIKIYIYNRVYGSAGTATGGDPRHEIYATGGTEQHIKGTVDIDISKIHNGNPTEDYQYYYIVVSVVTSGGHSLTKAMYLQLYPYNGISQSISNVYGYSLETPLNTLKRIISEDRQPKENTIDTFRDTLFIQKDN